MPDQYLLPCTCGKSIAVETIQAGQTIECPDCGSPVEVPSFSLIKKLALLESKAEEDNEVRRKSDWGYNQGVLFAVGLAVSVIFGILAGVFYYLYYGTNVETPTVHGGMKENFGAFVDSMTPAERFTFWEENQKKNPPAEWKPPEHLFTQTFSKSFFTLAIICASLTGLGLGCIVAAMLVKPNVKQQARRRRAAG